MSLFNTAKRVLLPQGQKIRTVPIGLYKGVRLFVDFQSQTQLYAGLIERETHPWIHQALQRADWIVDVGAGGGELICYGLMQPRIALVIACEPQEEEIEKLRESVAANGFAEGDRLVICQSFIGSAHGQTSLDRLMERRSFGRGFIKIDVEGAELDVLESGATLLSSGPIDLLIEVHSAQLERACLAWLQDRQYVFRVIGPAWWRRLVPEHRPTGHNRWIAATRDE